MTPALEALGERCARYLSERWGETVTVLAVAQIPGGASRETYRLAVLRGGRQEGLILRRDPTSSLIDTERALEYQTYAAVFPTGIPVPEPLVLEEDPQWLERPFSLMREITGCESRVPHPELPAETFDTLRPRLAEETWTVLGRIAALDLDALTLPATMTRPAHPARHELDYWAGVIEADALHPQPIADAARRWLERHLPPPGPRLALVHGDYRTGNFLYDDQGRIRGVLDWEMAHLGDPLEDLAWSLDPLWCWPERSLAGNLAPREEAVAIWERASGIPVDRQAFRWWQIFASYKGLANWISSAEDFIHGASKEPILAMAGWVTGDRQNRILLDRLSPLSRHEFAEAVL